LNREEKLADMIAKSQKLGLELRFENGLLAIRPKREIDDDQLATTMSGLAERAGEVRTITERRAIVASAQQFIGSRIWVHGYGEGTLEGGDADGRLLVRVRPEGFNNFTNVTATAETIVILDERPSEVPALPREGDPEPVGRKGLLQTVRERFK
jgi:hypothetical protein